MMVFRSLAVMLTLLMVNEASACHKGRFGKRASLPQATYRPVSYPQATYRPVQATYRPVSYSQATSYSGPSCSGPSCPN